MNLRQLLLTLFGIRRIRTKQYWYQAYQQFEANTRDYRDQLFERTARYLFEQQPMTRKAYQYYPLFDPPPGKRKDLQRRRIQNPK